MPLLASGTRNKEVGIIYVYPPCSCKLKLSLANENFMPFSTLPYKINVLSFFLLEERSSLNSGSFFYLKNTAV